MFRFVNWHCNLFLLVVFSNRINSHIYLRPYLFVHVLRKYIAVCRWRNYTSLFCIRRSIVRENFKLEIIIWHVHYFTWIQCFNVRLKFDYTRTYVNPVVIKWCTDFFLIYPDGDIPNLFYYQMLTWAESQQLAFSLTCPACIRISCCIFCFIFARYKLVLLYDTRALARMYMLIPNKILFTYNFFGNIILLLLESNELSSNNWMQR